MISTSSMSLKERKVLMLGLAMACKDSVGVGALSPTERKEVSKRMDALSCVFDKGTLRLWTATTVTFIAELRGMYAVQEGMELW